MEVAPRYWQRPETLNDIYVAYQGEQVPLVAFARFDPSNTLLSVSHQGHSRQQRFHLIYYQGWL